MRSPIIYIPIKEKSQRVPNKNFRILGDKTLWRHTIDKLSDFKVYIDTDCEKIIEECQTISYVNAFFREALLRGHETSVCRLISHFLCKYNYDGIVVQIHVTTPFLSVDTLKNAVSFAGHYDSVVSCNIVKTRLWRKENYGYCPINHNPIKLEQTQDLPEYYEENSAFYIFHAPMFQQKEVRVGSNPYFYPISFPENMDIDVESDWDLCTTYYEEQLNKESNL